MANEDKTITIKFRGDTTSFANSVSNIDKMIKVLQRDTKDIEKKIKLDPSNANEYANAINNTRSALELATRQYDAYGAEIEKYQNLNRELTDKEVNALDTAVRKRAEYGSQISNLTEQLARLNREQENFDTLLLSRNLETFGKQMQGVGDAVQRVADGFKYISLAAGAALGGSASAAITFEEAMANVRKVLRDDELQYFDTLQQGILDMSRELPITANEIAQVAANALQLGVSAKDVEKFTETILKLGTATDISAEDAAITLAQFFNVTGEDLQNVDKFGAVLVELGNRFPAFESGIMEMAQRIAAAGSGVGMTSDQLLGLSAALVSTGLNAESGGSAISTIIRNIDTQVATSGKKLSAWAKAAGMSIDDFKLAWKTDAAGTFQRIVNSISQSVDRGKNLNVILGELGISAIRQKDAFSRLVGASDTFNETLRDSANAWKEVEEGENGALNDEFENKVKTVAAQIQLLKNDLFYLGTEIGNIIMPYIREFVEWLRQLVEWFINLSPESKKALTGMLIAFASIYPVLKTIGKAISTVGKMLSGLGQIIGKNITLGVAKEGLGTAFSNLAKSVLTVAKSFAPWIAIIGVLAAAFINLFNNNEIFRNSILLLWADFKEKLSVIVEKLLGLFNDFSNWFTTVMQPIFDTIKEVWENWLQPAFASLLKILTELIFKFLVSLFEWIVKIIEWLINIAKPVIEAIINILKVVISVLGPIIKLVLDIISLIGQLISWLWDKLAPVISFLIDVIGGFVWILTEVLTTIANLIVEGIQKLVDWLGTLFSWFKDKTPIEIFKGALEGLKSVLKTVGDWISNIITKAGDAINKIRELVGLSDQDMGVFSMKRAGEANVTINANTTFNSNTPVSARNGAAVGNALVDSVNRKLGKMLTNF